MKDTIQHIRGCGEWDKKGPGSHGTYIIMGRNTEWTDFKILTVQNLKADTLSVLFAFWL